MEHLTCSPSTTPPSKPSSSFLQKFHQKQEKKIQSLHLLPSIQIKITPLRKKTREEKNTYAGCSPWFLAPLLRSPSPRRRHHAKTAAPTTAPPTTSSAPAPCGARTHTRAFLIPPPPPPPPPLSTSSLAPRATPRSPPPLPINTN